MKMTSTLSRAARHSGRREVACAVRDGRIDMGDVRAEFVLNTVLDAVSTASTRDALYARLASDEDGAMRAFLDDPTTTVFQATSYAGGDVRCGNVVSFDTSSACQVVLTKLVPRALTASDVPGSVNVSTISHSPV